MTGSLKGAEERDFLFSKLFCLISIIRSGKTVSIEAQHMNILERLLELHEQKGWMREVIVEGLLLFCFSLTDMNMITATIEKLKPLLTTTVNEMSAWQLCLSIGLFQLHNSTNTNISNLWQTTMKLHLSDLDVYKHPINLKNIVSLKDTLLAATAGYPKIHRIWEYLVSLIFPMDSQRELPSCR